jgi:transcriptional regulator with XRE-family HTH domain
MTAPERTATLTELIARRVRARMGWLGIRQNELARRVGENDQWVSSRINARTPISIMELQRFAKALEVGLSDLLPSDEEAAGAEAPQSTIRYPLMAERSPSRGSTNGNRPPGRPSGSTGPGVSRTAYVERPARRKRDR